MNGNFSLSAMNGTLSPQCALPFDSKPVADLFFKNTARVKKRETISGFRLLVDDWWIRGRPEYQGP